MVFTAPVARGPTDSPSLGNHEPSEISATASEFIIGLEHSTLDSASQSSHTSLDAPAERGTLGDADLLETEPRDATFVSAGKKGSSSR